jgi:GH43 family beta-xylosidase
MSLIRSLVLIECFSWYIYYAAGPCSNWEVTDQYTYVLKGGPSLWDEFTWIGKVNTPAFAIDSTVAVIENKDYFIYSCFRTEGGLTEASLCIADMFDPLTVGEEHLLSFPSDAWECVGDCVAEGPHALQRNGKTFLTYAGGSCSAPEYALGMLTYIGGDPLLQTSWQKAPEPVFRGTANVTSTGHNS